MKDEQARIKQRIGEIEIQTSGTNVWFWFLFGAGALAIYGVYFWVNAGSIVLLLVGLILMWVFYKLGEQANSRVRQLTAEFHRLQARYGEIQHHLDKTT